MLKTRGERRLQRVVLRAAVMGKYRDPARFQHMEGFKQIPSSTTV